MPPELLLDEEDDVPPDLWLQALLCRAPMVTTLTSNHYTTYTELKICLMRGVLQEHASEDDEVEAWWRLLLCDKLLFHKGGDNSLSLNAKIRARFEAMRDGEWLLLVQELLELSGIPKPPEHPPSEQ